MITLMDRANQTDYRKLVPSLAVTETIHNVEEAVWLPAWSQTTGMLQQPVGAFEFRFAVIALTLLVYGVVYYFARYDNRVARYMMAGALVMILFNVFVPHLAVTVILFRYAPGTISGILLNVPVCSYLLRRGVKEGIFGTKMIVFGAIGFAAVTGLLLPALFTVGALVGNVI